MLICNFFNSFVSMIDNIIRGYLHANKRLVVPGLGSFIRKESGGTVFVEFLKKDDGVLTGLVAKEYGLGADEAAEVAAGYADGVRRAVATAGRYVIEGVGTIRTDANGLLELAEGNAPASTPERAYVPASPAVSTPEPTPNEEPMARSIVHDFDIDNITPVAEEVITIIEIPSPAAETPVVETPAAAPATARGERFGVREIEVIETPAAWEAVCEGEPAREVVFDVTPLGTAAEGDRVIGHDHHAEVHHRTEQDTCETVPHPFGHKPAGTGNHAVVTEQDTCETASLSHEDGSANTGKYISGVGPSWEAGPAPDDVCDYELAWEPEPFRPPAPQTFETAARQPDGETDRFRQPSPTPVNDAEPVLGDALGEKKAFTLNDLYAAPADEPEAVNADWFAAPAHHAPAHHATAHKKAETTHKGHTPARHEPAREPAHNASARPAHRSETRQPVRPPHIRHSVHKKNRTDIVMIIAIVAAALALGWIVWDALSKGSPAVRQSTEQPVVESPGEIEVIDIETVDINE